MSNSACGKEPKINELTTVNERTKLPAPATDVAILRLVGVDNLAALIVTGATNAQIGETVGVPPSSVAMHIHNLDEADRATIRAARLQSAEQIIDAAGDIIDAPGPLIGTDDDGTEHRRVLTSAEVSLRKLQADHRYRRAAQRNAAFREKAPVDTDGPTATNTAPTFNFTLQVLPPTNDKQPVINITPTPEE